MGDRDYVDPGTDASRLNATRILYYVSGSGFFSFNVDTRGNVCTDMGYVMFSAPLTGVDCGVEAVRQEDEHTISALYKDGSEECLLHGFRVRLPIILPSRSDLTDVKRAFSNGGNCYYRGGGDRPFGDCPSSEYFHRVMRAYRDVFLLFDRSTRSWIFTRIVVLRGVPHSK